MHINALNKGNVAADINAFLRLGKRKPASKYSLQISKTTLHLPRNRVPEISSPKPKSSRNL